MTPDDHALDPLSFLAHQPLILYRLAKARFANLSGVGAALYPGRWNRPDEEAIYTSTEAGIPLLERLVHTPKDRIPTNLAMMKIRVEDVWNSDTRSLNAHPAVVRGSRMSGLFLICRTLDEANEEYHRNPKSFSRYGSYYALAVPSVIVPSWNVVLYPAGVGFWEHVSLESVRPSRLIRDYSPKALLSKRLRKVFAVKAWRSNRRCIEPAIL
jgi:RES domain-containing protein